MATIQIKREHKLDNAHIHSEISQLADKLHDEYDVEYHWEGDRLIFKRSGASGYMQLHEGELELKIKLNMLLSPLKGHIEKTVRDYLDERLA